MAVLTGVVHMQFTGDPGVLPCNALISVWGCGIFTFFVLRHGFYTSKNGGLCILKVFY
jgi:hypothetical protein